MIRKYPELGQYIDLGYFKWFKSNAGYYFDKNAISDMDPNVNGPFIVESPENTGYTRFNPLEECPSLFLRFADMDCTEQDYIHFANENGLLTGDLLLSNIPHNERRKEKIGDEIVEVEIAKKFIVGDPLVLWQKEHFILKYTVQVWEWLKDRNTNKLALVIRWNNSNKEVKYFLGSEKDLRLYHSESSEHNKIMHGTLASETSNSILLSHFIPNDVLLPAQVLIQQQINKKLKEYRVNPVLLMDNKNMLQQYLMPENLLSAMWFQFYQAVTGEKKYKKCEVCHKWEDITNKKSNWSKHPECAGRLRTANYRKKLADIKELYAHGASAAEIAEKYKESEEQIIKWIKE
jgi:hypothetical protein